MIDIAIPISIIELLFGSLPEAKYCIDHVDHQNIPDKEQCLDEPVFHSHEWGHGKEEDEQGHPDDQWSYLSHVSKTNLPYTPRYGIHCGHLEVQVI